MSRLLESRYQIIIEKNAAVTSCHMTLKRDALAHSALGRLLRRDTCVRAPTPRFFRRRAPSISGWGGSTFLFEVHADGWVSRQIQVFDDGRFILYDEIVDQDAYGGRSTERLDGREYESFRITKAEFFQYWDPDASVNRGNGKGG